MSLERQLKGYRLTTAEILYRRPDHPSLLQEYIWQDLDIAPGFPVLVRFLRFWERNLEGRLHTVRVASAELIRPAEFRWTAGVLRLH
ncbi:MAG: Usg family protein [Rhodospirillales bacterium]|nr:Usg family protein [Rhodospirillales bacterium]MBI2586858.1 Usg family protein [Rhodospirillales bacterium]